MKRVSFVVLAACVLALGLSVYASAFAGEQSAPASARQASSPAVVKPAAAPAISVSHTDTSLTESQTALVKQYCATCHNGQSKPLAGAHVVDTYPELTQVTADATAAPDPTKAPAQEPGKQPAPSPMPQ